MPVTLESNPNIIASQSQRDLGLLPGSCPLRRRLAQRLVSRVLRTLPAATYSGSVPERHGSLGICRPGLLISPQVQLGPFTRPASIVNLGSGTLKNEGDLSPGGTHREDDGFDRRPYRHLYGRHRRGGCRGGCGLREHHRHGRRCRSSGCQTSSILSVRRDQR